MNSISTPSNFLSLPPEVRHIVYKRLLSCRDSFQVAHYRRSELKNHPRLYPAILRTCKSIYSEALPYLYHNKISIDSCDAAASRPDAFLNRIGPHNAQLLTEMVVSDYTSSSLSHLFRSAPNLRILHIIYVLRNTAPPYHKQYVDAFYERLEPLVKEHPTIEKMVSRYRRGYCVQWPHLSIRCVAGDVDWEIRETDVDVRDGGVDMSGRVWLERLQSGKNLGPPPVDEVQW